MRYATDKSARELSPLPGCAQIVVSHNAFMFMDHRGKGLATNENKLGLAEMRRLGYDYAIATVQGKNTPQNKVLRNNGWLFLLHRTRVTMSWFTDVLSRCLFPRRTYHAASRR